MPRTTRIAARTLSAVAVVALGLSLGACSAEPEPPVEPAASESVAASPTPSPSPSPTELSPEDEAISKAEPAVRNYFRVADASLQDPKTFNPKRYEKVAISSALLELQNLHYSIEVQELHQVGGTKLDSIENPKVDLTLKPKETPPSIPNVEFTVCYDVTNLDTVKKNGESIITPARKDRGVARIGVANYEYPDGPWLVAFVEYKKKQTC